MNFLLKITTVLILVLATLLAEAQQITGRTTTGKKGTTNVSLVAKYEKLHPPKTVRRRPPNEEEEEERKRSRMQSRISGYVPPFSGKTTVIGSNETSLQRTMEFPCNNFRALDDDGTSFPPDVSGAAGFDHLMTALNTQILIQTKQGGNTTVNSLVGFWNGLGGHNDIFDPKITYDPYDKRWIFVCCATRRAAGSALLLAVSETSDPTGGWTTYTIDADPADLYWFDYPSLGFNRNWITVGGYMFDMPGLRNTPRSRVWVINKSTIYSGTPNITVSFFDRTDVVHISPAITYSPTENTQWLVTRSSSNTSNSGFYRLYSITGTQGAPVFNVGNDVNVGGA